jgi:hypothetical protein
VTDDAGELPDDDYDLQLMGLGKTIDRRVRCLLIRCARCELKVLRVERDNRDRGEPDSPFGALWTLGGLYVQPEGARNFRQYRPSPQGMEARRTYSWECAHGHRDTRTLERFLIAWPQHVRGGGRPPRVITLKLGIDV